MTDEALAAEIALEMIKEIADDTDEPRYVGGGNVGSPGKEKTGPTAMGIYERQLVALELRLKGYSYEEMRQILRDEYKWDYKNPTSIKNLVTRAMRVTKAEKIKTIRQLELARYDKLIGAHWEQALEGNVASTKVILRIMLQRGKMLGLDAPIKVARTDSKGKDIATLSDKERLSQIQSLVAKAKAAQVKAESQHVKEPIRVGDSAGLN